MSVIDGSAAKAQPSTDTYKSAAAAGFALLVQQYKKKINGITIFDGNIWFGGNALHVCLDYLVAAGEKDTGNDPKITYPNILSYAYNEVFKVLTTPSPNHDWWKDDYAWWGNAFVKAYESRQQLGYGDPSYNKLFQDILSSAQGCWQQLHDHGNWSETLFTSTQDNAAGSAPTTFPITGGAFNQAPPPKKPILPMSGRNCVTNEGFWILSQGLAHLVPANSDYATFAQKAKGWFDKWLDYASKYPAVGLLNSLGLVLERPTGNGTDSSWYWSGDQALYITARNADAASQRVAASAVKSMAVNGILHENMGFMNYTVPPRNLDQFIADYATGKGILMWSLASFPGAPFGAFIKTNAAAVWCNRLQPSNQFTFNWNWNDSFPGAEPKILTGKSKELCNLIMQAAGQGALNAALRVGLAGTQITC